MTRKRKLKRVALVLPLAGRRVLMQLRDMKEGIDAPGCWGFVGGSIDRGETPRAAAARELTEEVGFKAASLRLISAETLSEFPGIFCVAFCCELTVPLPHLRLTEGRDLRLADLAQISSGRLYSRKLRRSFPTAAGSYLEKTLRRALELSGFRAGS